MAIILPFKPKSSSKKTAQNTTLQHDTKNKVSSLLEKSKNIPQYVHYSDNDFLFYIGEKIPELLKAKIQDLGEHINSDKTQKNHFIISDKYFSDIIKSSLQQNGEYFALCIKRVFDFLINYYEYNLLHQAIEDLVGNEFFEELYSLWVEKIQQDGIIENIDITIEEDEIISLPEDDYIDNSDRITYDFYNFHKQFESVINQIILDCVTNFNTQYPQFSGVQKNEAQIQQYLENTKYSLLSTSLYMLRTFEYFSQKNQDPIILEDMIIFTFIIKELDIYKNSIIQDIYDVCTNKISI